MCRIDSTSSFHYVYESGLLVNRLLFTSENQIFIILISILVRCSEWVEPIAATCAKASSARLHWWQVD